MDEEDFEEFQTASQTEEHAPSSTKCLSVENMHFCDDEPGGVPTEQKVFSDIPVSDKSAVTVQLNSSANELSVVQNSDKSAEDYVREVLQRTVDEVVNGLAQEERLACESKQDDSTMVQEFDEDEDEDDFGDFAEPVTVITNGSAIESAVCETEDDFGDFDQADFGQPVDGFANFEQAARIEHSYLAAPEIIPVSREVFGNIIAELFTNEQPCPEHAVESASFQASIDRDFARCENVDDWECVVFRYESSNTRKALLGALCIDETPANCPRFAIDCLRKDLLQPVKKGASLNDSHPTEISDRAREVLSKIPDLSFMKAEVLTFPAAAIQAP